MKTIEKNNFSSKLNKMGMYHLFCFLAPIKTVIKKNKNKTLTFATITSKPQRTEFILKRKAWEPKKSHMKRKIIQYSGDQV